MTLFIKINFMPKKNNLKLKMIHHCKKENHFISLFNLIIILSIIVLISSNCSMVQEKNDKQPRPARGHEIIPSKTHNNDTICPEFEGMKTCCSDYQLKVLEKIFGNIESFFGGDGGCDICVVNLKRFWCYFKCSPNQSEFVELGDVTKYIIDGKEYILRDINYYLNESTNCKLFNSCKKTKFAATYPSMGNAIGFTNFQGIKAYLNIPAYISMKIGNDSGLEYDPCNLKVPENKTVRGYTNVTECSCNTCESSCNYAFNTSISVLNGVNWPLIVLFYLLVLVVTICLFCYRKHQKTKNKGSNYLKINSNYDS